jgi:two-component system LytT family sensor kinase
MTFGVVPLAFLGLAEIIIILVIFIFLALSIGVVVLVISLYRKSAVAKNEGQQKEAARIQLNAVRAQLNPHFMFNALAGIQNLMNKNDIDSANRYLGKFARLTRNVLEAKEQITIEDEISLLQDYLQMEQLRFSFNYTINVQPGLNIGTIEIPSMLIQPFAENTVKYGIADAKGTGNVNIGFSVQNKDLLLSIQDNGNGFKSNKNEGHGIKLMQNRIALFNAIHKDSKLAMDIRSGAEGALITNWL